MYAIQDQKDNHSSRFKFMDHEKAYNLFDAFVKAIILDDKVIDFSFPVKENEDGSFEFATLDLSFASISKKYMKMPHVVFDLEPEKPVEPEKKHEQEPKKPNPKKKKNESDEAFALRQSKAMDKYSKQWANYLIRQAKYNQAMEKYTADEKAYNEQHKAWEDRQAEYEEAMKDFSKEERALKEEDKTYYFHVDWLANHISEFAQIVGAKASLRLDKNRDLICVIFNQIATLRNKPEMGSTEDAKKLLERFAFRTLIRCDAPIRNGVLHFCNPDEHAFVLAFKEKVRIAKTHEAELAGSGIPTRNFAAAAYEGYGRNYKDFHVDYDADRTEAMLQVIYDKLSERFPTMPQQEFFKKKF